MRDVLRELIRGIIREVATNPKEALEKGLAMLEIADFDDPSFGHYLVLVDVSKLNEALDVLFSRFENSELAFKYLEKIHKNDTTGILTKYPFVLGMISYGTSRYPSKAWGAEEVHLAAAEKGYGPLMYDTAMALAGTLMSDRGAVSRSARKVWKKYHSRPDVEKLPLDDMYDPKTPTPVDDAEVFYKGSSEDLEALNTAYGLEHMPAGGAQLLRAGKQLRFKLNVLMSADPASVQSVEKFVYKSADAFFSMRYGDEVRSEWQ